MLVNFFLNGTDYSRIIRNNGTQNRVTKIFSILTDDFLWILESRRIPNFLKAPKIIP